MYSEDPPLPEQGKIDYEAFVEASQEVGLVCLHRHFEGTFTFSHLKELSKKISSDLGFDLEPRDETWPEIGEIMKGTGKRDLSSFIARFSTRWLRLMLIKGIMAGADGYEIIKGYVDFFLQLADKEGIKTIEFLFSPFAFCKEGDLGIDYIGDPPANAPKEEKQLINKWKTKFEQMDEEDKIPEMDRVCHAIDDLINEKKEYVALKKDQDLDKEHLNVGFRLCLRREQRSEGFLRTERHFLPASRQRVLIEQMIRLYNTGVIQGIDIAGVEHREDLNLYKSFLADLNKFGVPYTVHVAEMPAAKAEEAYKNLETAIDLGVLRLGHAVRLFDDNERANALLLRLLEQTNTIIEFNPTSNQWSGVVPKDSLAKHPIIRALRGDHRLFRERPELIQELWQRIVICDDDPVILAFEKKEGFLPLIDEHHKVLCLVMPTVYPEKLDAVLRGDEDVLQEILKELKTKGERALLAKMKKHSA